MQEVGAQIDGADAAEAVTELLDRLGAELLGNADGDDCADYCITLFSDLTRKVTMQNLYNDGGFSSMGMSLKAMNQYTSGVVDEGSEYTED